MTTSSDDIAAKIKRLRKAAGLTQEDVAERAGIPLSSYQGYEQGKATPPYERVEAILRVIGEATLEQTPVEHRVEQAGEPGVFHLTLTMNGQAFYRFRCVGEVLGDVLFDIDLDSMVNRKGGKEGA